MERVCDRKQVRSIEERRQGKREGEREREEGEREGE